MPRGQLDILAANRLGQALYSPVFADPARHAHNVRFHRAGIKRFHHPVVGDITLTFEADLAADAGLRINAYTAEPGSPSHDALSLLASWAATLDQTPAVRTTGRGCYPVSPPSGDTG